MPERKILGNRVLQPTGTNAERKRHLVLFPSTHHHRCVVAAVTMMESRLQVADDAVHREHVAAEQPVVQWICVSDASLQRCGVSNVRIIYIVHRTYTQQTHLLLRVCICGEKAYATTFR